MATRLQRLRRGPLVEAFPLAGPAFRRAAPWLIAAAFVLGLITRLHPALRYAVWGSDSGEYYFLTEQLVRTGSLSFDYEGWGLAYPYFPGMFVVSGAATAVLGVDVFHAVQLATPVLAALIPVLVGLFAFRVTSDPRAGVVAALFAAVTAPLVIVTSHAMPGTLGQVFLLALLCLIPDAYRDRRHWPLLALLAAALVLTHHLTTYFAIGIVAFTAFLREISSRASDRTRLELEVPLAGGVLALALVWWLGVADKFREEIVGDALDLPPLVTAAGFLLALAALPGLVILKRRYAGWIHTPRYPSFPRQTAWVLAIFLGVSGIVASIVLTKVPGTNIEVPWATFWYALPVVAFVAFLPLGTGTMRFHPHGSLTLGWLFAVLGSLVFSIVTKNHVLFPFRHVDYMIEAMAPLVAVGMLLVYDQVLAGRVPAEQPSARAWMAAALGALVLMSAVLSLPPRESIGGFEEGITQAEWTAVQWVRDHPELIPAGTTMAADHRISSMLWGHARIHATWDEGKVTYHTENVTVALEDLKDLRNPVSGERRVDYVFLSPKIEEGVTLVQWETSMPMSPGAIAKFEDERAFEKVYDEQSVRIYRVKWEALGMPSV